MISEFNPRDTIIKQLEDLESDFPDLVVNENQFTFGEVIGKGGFGEVYKAYDNKSKLNCAYKKIFRERLEGHRMKRYIGEIKTMASCDNMFLVPLVGFTADVPYCIVTEFMPHGSLDKYIRKKHPEDICPLSGSQLTSIAIGIAHGMMHLHEKGIIHRDLKAANIVLDKKFFPRICDFGIARFGDDGGMTQKIGTPNYMAPELIASNLYDNKVDVYAYAMILYEMSEGIRAFKGLKLKEIFNCVVNNEQRPEFSKRTPLSLQKLISRCWSQDPEERPSFEEIFELFKSNDKLAFPNSKSKEIKKFFKLIANDEKLRAPRREQREKELKDRQLARENGQVVHPRKKPAPIKVYSDEDEDYENERDDVIVVDHAELSPIAKISSNTYDLQNLKNIMSNNFDKNLTYFGNNLQPKQVNQFIQLLTPHLIEKGPISSIKLILHTIISMMNRDHNLASEIIKTKFFLSLPTRDDNYIDDCIDCYKILFTQYQKNLTENDTDNIMNLLKRRPRSVLCLFSSYVTANIDHDWSIIDILIKGYNIVLNSSEGVLLLSVFYYIMVTNELFAKAKGSKIIDIFNSFLKSNDQKTVIVAMNGLIQFHARIEQNVIPYLTQYLHDGVLWSHTLRYLASDDFTKSSQKGIKVTEELIRALVFRANENKLAVLILLRIASTTEGSRLLLSYPQWMIISDEHPHKAFQIFGVLFKNKNNRGTISISDQFPYFLKNLVLKCDDDFYFAAIPSILRRAFASISQKMGKRLVKCLTQSGFLSSYVEKVISKNDISAYSHLLIVTDTVARIDYSGEYLPIAQNLMSVMSNPTLFDRCISVFFILSLHKECARLFLNSGILEYIEQFKKYPQYQVEVTKFIEKVRSIEEAQ